MHTQTYIEIKLADRTCYVSHEDAALFRGFMGNTYETQIPFRDLPDDTFIVRLTWERKRAKKFNTEKTVEGIARKRLGNGDSPAKR
jgi:hypothetical protein